MKEIVIKISDDLHETIIDPNKWLTPKRVNKLVDAVLHGKVLPKGHGELKDAEVLKNSIDASDVDNSDAWDNVDSVCQIIDAITPLVEADKGE